MPQIFQVLRCYKCLVFQVHQTKKSNKWECKLCWEKQSIKRHYSIGTARDCRIHVQKLNCIRGEIDELKCSKIIKNPVDDNETMSDELPSEKLPLNVGPMPNSKWASYVEDHKPIEETTNDPMYLGDAQIVLEIPNKRRKQMRTSSKNHKEVSSVVIQNSMVPKNVNETAAHALESTSLVKPRPIKSPVIAKSQNIDKENTKPIPKKKFIPPMINKNSKWAQYADENDFNTPSSSIDNTDVKKEFMFPLCDDTELDEVLYLL